MAIRSSDDELRALGWQSMAISLWTLEQLKDLKFTSSQRNPSHVTLGSDTLHLDALLPEHRCGLATWDIQLSQRLVFALWHKKFTLVKRWSGRSNSNKTIT
jgi:hypothetical protein